MTRATAWFVVYLALVSAPLVLLLTGPVPPGLGFTWDLAMALGFAGLAVMAVQFVLTARFKRATAPFGVDIVYYLHRYLGVVALAFVLGHAVLTVVDNPQLLGALLPGSPMPHLTAGAVSLFAMVVIAVTSIWRQRLRLPYDGWRMAHAVLAVLAIGLAWVHMDGVRYYLAEPRQRFLWVGILASLLGVILLVRVIRPWRLRARPWRVARIAPERGNAWTLALEPVGHPGLQFQAGQFAWVTLRASPFAMREHPFSIASSARRADHIVEFTIKELGDFTNTIGTVVPGEAAWVDGPYGVFCVERYHASRVVFIAGGIGMVPIMCMLRTLADAEDQRPLLLVYAGSHWDRLPFREELEALRNRLSLTIVYVLEEPPDGWTGERGWITRALLERILPAPRDAAAYFLCGPRPMTRAVERMLRAIGVPLSRVHTELFDMG